MRMSINVGSASVSNLPDYYRCADKLEVCRKCKKHFQEHYIASVRNQNGTLSFNPWLAQGTCDPDNKIPYEQMTNLELIEHMESIQQ